MKRLFDIIFAAIGLALLSIPMLFVWVVVVACYGLPGLFRQQRVGRGGRPFTMLKFRTMTERKAEGRNLKPDFPENAGGGSFDAGDTSRVTSVGRVLRITKLDELPQLWNVLKGDMSLVGPRPEVRKWVEAYPERWAKVLTVRPGITDPASIEFRNEEHLLATSSNPESVYRNEVLPRKLELYEDYVASSNFWRDIGILLKTVWKVIKS